MIPREGGNRWSGDFKAVNRPGTWQSSNLTARLRDQGLGRQRPRSRDRLHGCRRRGATAVERIVQLDFKVSRTFRAGRVSLIPTFEVFNVNNSDANMVRW